MSLASLSIYLEEFDELRLHLETSTRYRNMHLREARYRNKVRTLRYLHAMYAPSDRPKQIEGMISGPDVFCQYVWERGRSVTRLKVISQQGTVREFNRLQTQFVPEIEQRMRHEQTGETHYPSYLSGEFYLKRADGGMVATHPNCVAAVANGVLDQRFVNRLVPWNLMLLHP